MRVSSLSQEDPLDRKMATFSSVLAVKSHGQKNLASYSPGVCKESDTMGHTETGPPATGASQYE